MADEKKVPQVVTEKIPEKFLEKILKIKEDVQKLNDEFFNLANQQVAILERLSAIKKQRDSKTESFNSTMKLAAGKLQLAKKTGFNWRYDGNENFVGVEVPPKPEPKGEVK